MRLVTWKRAFDCCFIIVTTADKRELAVGRLFGFNDFPNKLTCMIRVLYWITLARTRSVRVVMTYVTASTAWTAWTFAPTAATCSSIRCYNPALYHETDTNNDLLLRGRTFDCDIIVVLERIPLQTSLWSVQSCEAFFPQSMTITSSVLFHFPPYRTKTSSIPFCKRSCISNSASWPFVRM